MPISLIALSIVFLLLLDPIESVKDLKASIKTDLVLKYVAVGASDSVGVGTFHPSKDGWVPKFANLIHANTTIILGRSGSTLADAMNEQLPKVFYQKPNVLTIWLAVNDFNRQILNPLILLNYRSDFNKMLRQLRTKLDNNTRILVGNMPDLSQVTIYQWLRIPKDLLNIQVKQWNNAISDAVEIHQCELVDLFSHWKELAGHPEYISVDGFHPSAEGYTRIAEIFYEEYNKN